jgi:rod shape-determining protein MreC
LEQVYETSSQIQLITNKSFRMVAHLKGDNRPVTFQGNGVLPGGQGHGILYDIPADVIIPKGSDIQVVSSNLSGTYPKGLHIGTISELAPSVDGVFKVGKVLLSPQLSLLSEVTILKDSNAK